MGPQIIRTLDFLGFGGFWEEVFFRRFWGPEKSAQNLEKSAGGAKQNLSRVFFGRPGGMRGAAGEVRRGLEPLRVWQGSGNLGLGKNWQELEVGIRHAVPRRGRRIAPRIPLGLNRGSTYHVVFDVLVRCPKIMVNDHTIDQQWDQSGPGGGARGTRKSMNIWKSKKNANAKK